MLTTHMLHMSCLIIINPFHFIPLTNLNRIRQDFIAMDPNLQDMQVI